MPQWVSKMTKWATDLHKLAAYSIIFVAKIVVFYMQKINFKVFSANIKTPEFKFLLNRPLAEVKK